MALRFGEFMGFAQAASGDYRYGLNRAPKKACCSSCSRGGPCAGGGFHGLGQGQEDLEPPPEGFGPKYVQTTKAGTTVFSETPGRAPVRRRVNVTGMIEELEFLAGTPGIHPRVLAQKAWQARKALMETSRWDWAQYADPRSRYDSYEDLVARLQAVERVLGIDKVSPKIMSALYGMGGLGALGKAPWGASMDPVRKLAGCIRSAICFPKGFCCPSGSRPFVDPYELEEFELEEFEPEPEEEAYYEGPAPILESPRTSISLTTPQPQPQIAIRQPAYAVAGPGVLPTQAISAVAPAAAPTQIAIRAAAPTHAPAVAQPASYLTRAAAPGALPTGAFAAAMVPTTMTTALAGLGARRGAGIAVQRLRQRLRATRNDVRRARGAW